MKQFEFFKPEDGVVTKMWDGLYISIERANRLLNERSHHVYSSEYIPQSGGHSISTSKYSRDTHEALVVCSRYIEPEKVECEHMTGLMMGTNIINYDFCPKCGDELK